MSGVFHYPLESFSRGDVLERITFLPVSAAYPAWKKTILKPAVSCIFLHPGDLADSPATPGVGIERTGISATREMGSNEMKTDAEKIVRYRTAREECCLRCERFEVFCQ